jgi:hypothetical protein
MTEYQRIGIDFEVWKELTARLEAPSDTYNDALRQLLGFPRAAHPDPGQTPPTDSSLAWVVDGVSFPEGTEFRKVYKHKEHRAVVRQGALWLDGTAYETPTSAAMAITGNNVNGWRFWEFHRQGRARWHPIDILRQLGEAGILDTAPRA